MGEEAWGVLVAAVAGHLPAVPGPQPLLHLAMALARAGGRGAGAGKAAQSELWQKLGDRLAEVGLRQLSVTNLANLAAAFAMAGHRHVSMLDSLAAELLQPQRRRHLASARQLAVLVGSYGQLGYSHNGLMACIDDSLQTMAPRLQPADAPHTVNLSAAYSALHQDSPSLYNTAVQHASQHMLSLSTPAVAKLLHVCAQTTQDHVHRRQAARARGLLPKPGAGSLSGSNVSKGADLDPGQASHKPSSSSGSQGHTRLDLDLLCSSADRACKHLRHDVSQLTSAQLTNVATSIATLASCYSRSDKFVPDAELLDLVAQDIILRIGHTRSGSGNGSGPMPPQHLVQALQALSKLDFKSREVFSVAAQSLLNPGSESLDLESRSRSLHQGSGDEAVASQADTSSLLSSLPSQQLADLAEVYRTEETEGGEGLQLLAAIGDDLSARLDATAAAANTVAPASQCSDLTASPQGQGLPAAAAPRLDEGQQGEAAAAVVTAVSQALSERSLAHTRLAASICQYVRARDAASLALQPMVTLVLAADNLERPTAGGSSGSSTDNGLAGLQIAPATRPADAFNVWSAPVSASTPESADPPGSTRGRRTRSRSGSESSQAALCIPDAQDPAGSSLTPELISQMGSRIQAAKLSDDLPTAQWQALADLGVRQLTATQPSAAAGGASGALERRGRSGRRPSSEFEASAISTLPSSSSSPLSSEAEAGAATTSPTAKQAALALLKSVGEVVQHRLKLFQPGEVAQLLHTMAQAPGLRHPILADSAAWLLSAPATARGLGPGAWVQAVLALPRLGCPDLASALQALAPRGEEVIRAHFSVDSLLAITQVYANAGVRDRGLLQALARYYMLHVERVAPPQALALTQHLLALGHWDLHLVKVLSTHVIGTMTKWSTPQLLALQGALLRARMHHGLLYRKVADRFLQDTRRGKGYPFAFSLPDVTAPATASGAAATASDDAARAKLREAAKQLHDVMTAYSYSHVKDPVILARLGKRALQLLQACYSLGSSSNEAVHDGGSSQSASDDAAALLPPVRVAEMVWVVGEPGGSYPQLFQAAADVALVPNFPDLSTHVKWRLAQAYAGAVHSHDALLAAMRADVLALQPPGSNAVAQGGSSSGGSMAERKGKTPWPADLAGPPASPCEGQQATATLSYVVTVAWWASKIDRLDPDLQQAVTSYCQPMLHMMGPADMALYAATIATAYTGLLDLDRKTEAAGSSGKNQRSRFQEEDDEYDENEDGEGQGPDRPAGHAGKGSKQPPGFHDAQAGAVPAALDTTAAAADIAAASACTTSQALATADLAVVKAVARHAQRVAHLCSEDDQLQLLGAATAAMEGLTPGTGDALRAVRNRIQKLEETRSKFRKSWKYHKMGFWVGQADHGRD